MATEQQISKLAGSLVEHQSGFAALSNEDAQWVITETKNAIALFCEAVKNRVRETAKAAQKLLEFVTSVTLHPVKHFEAAEHFTHGETVKGVRCYLWDSFRTRFGAKVERDIAGGEIRVHKILRQSRNLEIRAEITKEKEETFLAHIWQMLKLQPGGEAGALHVNGLANIFYVRDIEGALWAVYVSWHADTREWSLGALSVERADGWHADCQVCSRGFFGTLILTSLSL